MNDSAVILAILISSSSELLYALLKWSHGAGVDWLIVERIIVINTYGVVQYTELVNWLANYQYSTRYSALALMVLFW